MTLAPGPPSKPLSLTKSYSGVDALSDLSLTVERGSIYGFLGPNGAGKTTTIRLLMGFIRPTRGHARRCSDSITGSEGVRARSHMGYLVQSDALFPDLSGADQLASPNNSPARVRRCKTGCSTCWNSPALIWNAN